MSQRRWRLPPIQYILDPASETIETDLAQEQVSLIEETLAELEIPAQINQVFHSARLTKFSLVPQAEVKIATIKRVEQDLAVALSGALMEIEPPTPTDPTIGLLVENKHQTVVKLGQVIDTSQFRRHTGLLKLGLGLDTTGKPLVVDLADLPHLLIGGTTGSGKSVCLNTILASLLSTYPPNLVKLVLIDPLEVELEIYNGVPHLLQPVIARTDHVLKSLQEVNTEVEQRYQRLAEARVRNIAAYNQKAQKEGGEILPYWVILVDNLLDLMMDAPKDLEAVISQLAQKARAAGIHLILVSLRSQVDVVAGAIKANFPARITFRVADRYDSRSILDMEGAENLLGRGDMLYKSPEGNLIRAQGAYTSEAELGRIVQYWRNMAG